MYLEWSLGEAQASTDLTLQRSQQLLKQLCHQELHTDQTCSHPTPVRNTHVGSFKSSSLGSLSGMKRLRSAKTSSTRVGSRNLHGASSWLQSACSLGLSAVSGSDRPIWVQAVHLPGVVLEEKVSPPDV